MPIKRVDLLLSSPQILATSTTDIGDFLRERGAPPYLHALYPGHEDGARYIANVTYAASVSKYRPWPVNIQRRRKVVGMFGYNDRTAPDEIVLALASQIWSQANVAARYGRRMSDQATSAILFVTDSPRLLTGMVVKILSNQPPINPTVLTTLDLIQIDLQRPRCANAMQHHHFQSTPN